MCYRDELEIGIGESRDQPAKLKVHFTVSEGEAVFS
jgi:hypothetical protein